jgi:acyl-coenzyme A synthetase/AMP-(fatty) acid ligase
MFAPSRLGGILDLGLGLRWDRARLEREVASRASILSRQGIGRGSLIAIAHDGSANFFADLLAVWTLGATAACLDSGLTQSEFKTVIEFAEPAAILMDERAVKVASEIPVLQLANRESARCGGIYDARIRRPSWRRTYQPEHAGRARQSELSLRQRGRASLNSFRRWNAIGGILK